MKPNFKLSNVLRVILLILFFCFQNVQPVGASALAQTIPIETITAGTGTNFACRIKNNGFVSCWGNNDYGQTYAPSAVVFTQVSAGWAHTCGLDVDGVIYCWGYDGNGRTTPPDGVFIQVNAGDNFTCGLKSDGMVVCWGGNDYGQLNVLGDTFKQISAGSNNVCGIKSDDTVACWGANDHGQSTPPSGTFKQVSVFGNHACGVQSDGTVACWGSNTYGESTPAPGIFTQISVSFYYSCGLNNVGEIICWGSNIFGNNDVATPSGSFTQISVSYSFACALKVDNTPLCWGKYGTMDPITVSGNTSQPYTSVKYTLDGLTKRVSSDPDGNYSFQVPYNWSGTVTPDKPNEPELIAFFPASRSYTNLVDDETEQNYVKGQIIEGDAGASGVAFSYEVDNTQLTVYSGTDGNYTLHVPYNWSGTVTPSLNGFHFKPASRTYTSITAHQVYHNYAITSGVAFPQISAQANQSCQLKSNGKIICWGDNNNGQVSPPDGTFSQIGVGSYNGCGLQLDGTIVCWGNNFYGQSTPPIGKFIQLSVGDRHACALRSNGRPVCWGDNSSGQKAPIPAGVFTQIGARGDGTCALTSAGTLVCWGANSSYAPTSGTFISLSGSNCAIKTDGEVVCWPQYSTPSLSGVYKQVSSRGGFICGLKQDRTLVCKADTDYYGESKPPAGNFIQVAIGMYHGCGLKADERVVCWGLNDSAQLEPGKMSFTSNQNEDGSILESTETSGLGGLADARQRTLAVGDDMTNRQYRAVVSFNTSFIPNNAVITSAFLKLKAAGFVGGNPFLSLGKIWLDIRKGPFAGSFALTPKDFDASASAVKVGSFTAVTVKNWYSATLSPTGFAKIDKDGTTQLRLYFEKDDNNNMHADYVSFGSGSFIGRQPVLIIGTAP